ncbi:MAG: lysoplasmalogenase family protein [Velocimicrobium sp.]
MNFIGNKFFLIIETVLYLGFLSLDICGFFVCSAYLKYSAIVLLFFFVFIRSFQLKKSFLIPISLGFSVFADFFLLFSSNYIPGLLAFLIVQGILFVRLHEVFFMRFQLQLKILAILLVCGMISYIVFSIRFDVVTALALLYFFCFLNNIILAVFQIIVNAKWKNKSMLLFTLGLFLFFLCDIHVGLHNLSTYMDKSNLGLYRMGNWFYFAMWFFYLPGQMMIGMSNLLFTKNTKNTCKSEHKMI